MCGIISMKRCPLTSIIKIRWSHNHSDGCHNSHQNAIFLISHYLQRSSSSTWPSYWAESHHHQWCGMSFQRPSTSCLSGSHPSHKLELSENSNDNKLQKSMPDSPVFTPQHPSSHTDTMGLPMYYFKSKAETVHSFWSGKKNRRAVRFYQISSAILNDVIWLMINERQYTEPEKLIEIRSNSLVNSRVCITTKTCVFFCSQIRWLGYKKRLHDIFDNFVSVHPIYSSRAPL